MCENIQYDSTCLFFNINSDLISFNQSSFMSENEKINKTDKSSLICLKENELTTLAKDEEETNDDTYEFIIVLMGVVVLFIVFYIIYRIITKESEENKKLILN